MINPAPIDYLCVEHEFDERARRCVHCGMPKILAVNFGAPECSAPPQIPDKRALSVEAHALAKWVGAERA